jgi:NADH-quinone oxidoreductase subunit K
VISLDQVIGLSAVLFMIGVIGVATRRNLIVVLMCIELMLNAASQVFVLIVIAVAAAEVAVGLGIVISMFRNRDSVNLEEVSLLKW